MKRRRFLWTAGITLGAVMACDRPGAISIPNKQVLTQPRFSAYPFSLGVASGDPWPTSVVLWTRLAPNPLQAISLPRDDIEIRWQVATDEQMTQVVAQGTALATPELAHSVRVVVEGLQPARWYWYRFKAGTEISPVGRTRTTPAPGDAVAQLRFAIASCQHYEHGYFTAYRHLAQENLDLVFHLGDYIYEGPPRNQRTRRHVGPNPVDLDSYRLRHALYKTDPDLQAAHAAAPFIVTWDDHEVENDYANDESQTFVSGEAFLKQRTAAYQAYYEHMPLRPSTHLQGANLQLYRRFRFGTLAEFSVLDTRQYRDDQPCDSNGKGGAQLVMDCAERHDPNRSMLGTAQEQWLTQGWSNAQTTWNVLTQQQLMAPLELKIGETIGAWSDGWDGYTATRTRLLQAMAQQQLSNPIVLGGDLHSYWVTDLQLEPEAPPIATEFVGTSISSNSSPQDISILLAQNPHIKYYEKQYRGYLQCTVTPTQWTSHLRTVETVKQPNASIRTLASFAVAAGQPGAQPL